MIIVMPDYADIFETEAEAMVNPVNCVGVMGKGLAKKYKERFPAMEIDYRRAYLAKQLRLGTCHVYERSGHHREDVAPHIRWIINFPTKHHWSQPAKISYITTGLSDLRTVIRARGIRSIAIPGLGCGLGGLTWDAVFPVLTEMLDDLDCEIELYPPEPHMADANAAPRSGDAQRADRGVVAAAGDLPERQVDHDQPELAAADADRDPAAQQE